MKIQKYLAQSPVFAINAAYEAVIPRINRELKEEGLDLLQGLVLSALFFEEGKEVTPSQLAEQFQTSRGNMSHILSHLESKGWVRRVVNGKDARQFQIELKPEGKKKALSLIRFYDRLQDLFEQSVGMAVILKTVQGLRALTGTYRESLKE